MSKLKVMNQFGVAPNSLLNNPDISLKAKGLFAFMQSKPENWDFTVKNIESQSKEGIDSIRSAILELESAGYLVRRRYQVEKGHWQVEYQLYDHPVKINPGLENPMQENPTLENPVTGKPENISNKDLSKKELSNKDPNYIPVDPTKVESRFKMGVSKNGVIVCELLTQACREYYKANQTVMPSSLYPEFIAYWSKQNKKGIPRYVASSSDWILDAQIKLFVYKHNKPPINIAFEIFWEAYGLKKGKEKCRLIWDKLSDTDRSLIMEDLPKYFETLREAKFKMYPVRYLTEKSWLDEREVKPTPAEQKGPEPPATEKIIQKKFQMDRL